MITVLMATYNGGAYIAGQIESIMSQSRQGFRLLINDDASTDGTFAIAARYAEKYPDKITASQNRRNTGCAKHNFLNMMAAHKSAYVMLCDQDDVWLPDKIELSLAMMKEMEAACPGTPILVHTDLKVVDRDLKTLHESYKHATKRDCGRTKLQHALTLNNVTGCTAMYNRELADLLGRGPRYCVMHDWWLQLVAASFGKIGYVKTQTVFYRQHGGNALGAKNVRSLSYKVGHLLDSGHIKNRIRSTFAQAESLLEAYGDMLSDAQRQTLERYISIPRMSKPRRWHAICSLGATMGDLGRDAAYFLFV